MLFPSHSAIEPSWVAPSSTLSYFARNDKADFFAALRSALSLHIVESFCWWGHIFRDSAFCIEVSLAFLGRLIYTTWQVFTAGGKVALSLHLSSYKIHLNLQNLAPSLVLFIKSTKLFHIYFSDIFSTKVYPSQNFSDIREVRTLLYLNLEQNLITYLKYFPLAHHFKNRSNKENTCRHICDTLEEFI